MEDGGWRKESDDNIRQAINNNMEGINRIPSLQRDCDADVILGEKTTVVSVSVVTAVEVETAEASVANDDGSSIFQLSVLLCLPTIGSKVHYSGIR